MTNQTQKTVGVYDFSPSVNEPLIVIGGPHGVSRTIYKAVQRGQKVVMIKSTPRSGYMVDIGDAKNMADARAIILARARANAALTHGQFDDYTDLAPYMHEAKA